MMNIKNRLPRTLLLLISFLSLMDTVVDASWLTRRRRRKELAQKEQVVDTEQKKLTAKKTKITDLKQFIDAADDQTVITSEPNADTPVQEPVEKSIFDEDKYALPMELQHEAPKPRQIEAKKEEEPLIEFNFEKASLLNLIQQVEAIFDVTFITDDIIKPLAKGAVQIEGNTITFKTHEPLSKQEAWTLFITFLDVSGFALVQQATPRMYRIKPVQQAYQSTLRVFIGSDIDELPDSDEIIRFMYFIENSDVRTLEPIINSLRSPTAPVAGLLESKAILITDKSYNIKSLMKIIKELDKVSMPQAMSVLKLQQANAEAVQKLYEELTKPAGDQPPRMIGLRKPSASMYFPENTKIIAEPRTNSLILLGQRDAIQKIEDFIIKNIDIDLEQPYSPLYIYKLKYADADTIAAIMNKTSQLGEKTPGIGISGGVRGGDKYLKPISFTPEKETNQLIIKGSYEDYMAAKEIIDRLDVAQPQIAIEVLILELTLNNTKSIGTQLRSKETGCADNLLGKNIKFQTSGLFGKTGIVTNTNGPGVTTLLGNLINLVTAGSVGSTVLTLGQDLFGVWGVLALLESIANVQIVSNPFLVATNKAAASVKVGQTRRVVNATITTGGPTQAANTPQEANLQVTIKPQINSDGMIILDINVHIERFLDVPVAGSTATTNLEDVNTFAIVADKEVLALGGLIQNTLTDTITKVPILGDIPIIGWLFKNKTKTLLKSNLLILISSQIIKPEKAMQNQPFTKEHIDGYRRDLARTVDPHDERDPVYRSFFKSAETSTEQVVDSFLFERHKKRKKPALNPVLAPAIEREKEENRSTIHEVAANALADMHVDIATHAAVKKKERTRSSLRDYMSADILEGVS